MKTYPKNNHPTRVICLIRVSVTIFFRPLLFPRYLFWNSAINVTYVEGDESFVAVLADGFLETITTEAELVVAFDVSHLHQTYQTRFLHR